MRAVGLAERKTTMTKRKRQESYEPSYRYLPQARPDQRYRQFMHSVDSITTGTLSVNILMTYACPIRASWLSRVVSDRPQATPTGWYRFAINLPSLCAKEAFAMCGFDTWPDDTRNGR